MPDKHCDSFYERWPQIQSELFRILNMPAATHIDHYFLSARFASLLLNAVIPGYKRYPTLVPCECLEKPSHIIVCIRYLLTISTMAYITASALDLFILNPQITRQLSRHLDDSIAKSERLRTKFEFLDLAPTDLFRVYHQSSSCHHDGRSEST